MLRQKLDNLFLLVRKSKSVEKLDNKIKNEIIKLKRSYLEESIKKAIQEVEESAERSLSLSIQPRVDLLVSSGFHAFLRGGRHKEVILSSPIFKPYKFNNPEGHIETLVKFDSQDRRIIYFDEFVERCRILIEAIERGELDDFFGVSPFEILHQINGRHGELLLRLGINPWDSRIYKEAQNVGLLIPVSKKSE
jgi:hypothetical protein